MVQTINKANTQARPGGILFASANGKLCFVQQTPFLQHKTTCPKGEKTLSEVGVSFNFQLFSYSIIQLLMYGNKKTGKRRTHS